MNKIFPFILLLILSPGLPAQQKLSLDSCRTLALQQSELLKIADLQVEKAKAEKAAVRTNFLPSLSGSATGIYLNESFEQELYMPTAVPDMSSGELQPNIMINPDTGEPVVGADGNPVFNMYAWLPLEISLQGAYIAGISLEQPLFTGGKIVTGNKMASLGLEMAGENRSLQKMNALYEADQAYWIYVSVKEKVKLAEVYTKLLEELVATINDAYETGMTTRNEVLKAQVKLNEAKLQLQKARSGHELTRMALCRITGLDYHTAIIATDSVICITPFIEENHESAVSQRPEFFLLKKQLEMAEQQVKLTRADFLPTAGVSVGYNYLGGIEVNSEAYTNGSMSVMASVKIPLFHWGEGMKKIQSAKSEQAIKALELERNSRLMQLESEQARLNLRDAALRVEMATEAQKQADENLRISKNNYETGLEILPNLLEAQAQWQSAHNELIDSKTDYKMKESAWLKATGNLKQ